MVLPETCVYQAIHPLFGTEPSTCSLTEHTCSAGVHMVFTRRSCQVLAGPQEDEGPEHSSPALTRTLMTSEQGRQSGVHFKFVLPLRVEAQRGSGAGLGATQPIGSKSESC